MNFLLRIQSRTAVVLLLTALFAGCGRDDIKVYRVAKEQPVPPPMLAQGGLPAGHPDTGSGQPRLTWKTPEGWQERPPAQMRLASFLINGKDGKQADVSVIPLGGMAGGDAANVNRWRGQVGLEALSPDDLKKQAQPVEAGGQPAELYEIAGKNPANNQATRILGAVQHRDETAWFYKMTGDDELVAAQKTAFIEFLKSLRFGSASAPAAAPSGALPAGHPEISSSATSTAAKEGDPKWEVPSGWKKAEASQFLFAKFTIADSGNQAAVNVSTSVGAGGGILANVNRWRQQLGLAPANESDLANLITPMDVAGGKASVVDMNGVEAATGQPTRVIGAIVPQEGKTWFYKLTGHPGVVATQREAFIGFVQSVKY